MKTIIPILLLTLLGSCSTENPSLSLASSQPTTTSSLAASLSSVMNSSSSVASQVSSRTTSSIVTNSSSVISSSVVSTSLSVTTPLSNDWSVALGNINRSQFYGITETLPTTLSSKNVITVHAVYRLDGSLYGYAYEALVDGNGGTKTNRFRLGLVNNQFTGFQSVSHQEHNGIGTVIIQALATQLAGNTATFSAALQIMLNANSTLTGFTASVTLVGMRPALEAIVTHYLSKI
jgi:hypothetical protein